MDQEVGADLLKICWAPLGFKLSGDRHYAVKFHVHAKQLHTMLTDYEHIYYENAMLTKKFSSLNAKLSGTEKMLLEKIRDIFLSPKTKVSEEKMDKDVLEFGLETAGGKRTLKWHFSGQLLEDSGNCIYLHITRPLLNILSAVVDECDLSSLTVSGSGSTFNDPFGKPEAQKLYEAVAVEPQTVREGFESDNDDGNDDEIEENVSSSVNDIARSNDDGENSDNSLSSTPPPTPPPTAAPKITNDTVHDDEYEEVQRSVSKSPRKKPRLKF